VDGGEGVVDHGSDQTMDDGRCSGAPFFLLSCPSSLSVSVTVSFLHVKLYCSCNLS
jgi:hypothetical protein